MKITRGYKFRIYPNKEQQLQIAKTLGCCRYVYNYFLDLRSNAYKENKTSISFYKSSAMLTELKRELVWLKEVDSIALEQSLKNLDNAFQNFFKKNNRYPVFHSKHDNNQSYRTRNTNNSIHFVGKYITIPKLGRVKIRQSREVNGRILNATICKAASGKYYVSLCVEEEMEPMKNNGGEIGIDVGIKEFYSDSNGNFVSNPKYLEKSMRKLIREQRRLSRKQKGSNNRNKQRIKLALVHEKITNQRNDFLQKESTRLVRENQTICIEDLKVKNMMRNHKLAQHISSVSWSKFFNMLEYKAVWYGSKVIKVPTTYPSSQTCSCCGYKNPLVKNLKVRNWECPECHTKHERDFNASINILNKGLQIA